MSIADKLREKGMYDPSKNKDDGSDGSANPNGEPKGPKNNEEQIEKPQNTTDYTVEWDKVQDDQVFSRLTEKVGREIKSWEDLQPQVTEREVEKIVQPELPPEIEAIFNFHKETGRGVSDFVKAQKDWSQENDDSVLREYLTMENPELTRDHINLLMEGYKSPSKLEGDDYTPEEIAENTRRIKLAEIAKIKDVAKARKYFEDSKQKYLTPLEQNKQELAQREVQGKEAWVQKTQEAMQSISGVSVDDFSYSFKDKDSFTESASNIESLLGRYKDGEGKLDHTKLYKTLMAGEQLEGILKDYGAHIEAKTIKGQLERKVNPTLDTDDKSKRDQPEDKAAAAKEHLLNVLQKQHGHINRK